MKGGLTILVGIYAAGDGYNHEDCGPAARPAALRIMPKTPYISNQQ